MTGITAVASLSSCASQKKTEEQRPYNIVYIMTDDHTAQMMSCYDKRYMETPNLDRIANDGVRFTNSFVANSLSGPSRACMITGKHSCANKFYDNTTCMLMVRNRLFEAAATGRIPDRPYRKMALRESAHRFQLLGDCTRTR